MKTRPLTAFGLIALSVLSMLIMPAQAQTLVVGNVVLKLGMPENNARELLENTYRLSPLGKNSLSIWSKDGPPYSYIGGVAFTQGKVSWISREWGSYDAKPAVELGDEIVSALKRLSLEGQRTGRVVVKSAAREPDVTADSIEFEFDQWKLVVLVQRGRHDKAGDQVTLEESVKTR